MWGEILSAVASLAGGYMSDKSGKNNKAHRYAKERNAAVDAYIKQMQEQSRGDLMGLWPGAMDNMNMGYQGALDLFGQTIPQQMGTFQQGNMNAQNTLLAGMDPYMAALMGNPVDMSGLQPRGVNYDTSWIPQQLPEYRSAADLLGGGQPNPNQTPSSGQSAITGRGGSAGGAGEPSGGLDSMGAIGIGFQPAFPGGGLNDAINRAFPPAEQGRQISDGQMWALDNARNIGNVLGSLAAPGGGAAGRLAGGMVQDAFWARNAAQSPIPADAQQPYDLVDDIFNRSGLPG